MSQGVKEKNNTEEVKLVTYRPATVGERRQRHRGTKSVMVSITMLRRTRRS